MARGNRLEDFLNVAGNGSSDQLLGDTNTQLLNDSDGSTIADDDDEVLVGGNAVKAQLLQDAATLRKEALLYPKGSADRYERLMLASLKKTIAESGVTLTGMGLVAYPRSQAGIAR